MNVSKEEIIEVNVQYDLNCINNSVNQTQLSTSIKHVDSSYYYPYVTILLHRPIYITEVYDISLINKNNMVKNTSLNSCGLDYKMLFFDIFKKNKKLFLIIPVYSSNIKFIDTLRIENNGKNLELKYTFSKIKQEPIIILIYDFISTNNYITIKLNKQNIPTI